MVHNSAQWTPEPSEMVHNSAQWTYEPSEMVHNSAQWTPEPWEVSHNSAQWAPEPWEVSHNSAQRAPEPWEVSHNSAQWAPESWEVVRPAFVRKAALECNWSSEIPATCGIRPYAHINDTTVTLHLHRGSLLIVSLSDFQNTLCSVTGRKSPIE
jgi:hypothetical protein